MMGRYLLCVVLCASFASLASAQSKQDFSTVRFSPAPGAGNFVTVDGAKVGAHLNTSYGVFLEYATNTLVVEDECSNIPNVSSLCANKDVAFLRLTGLAHLTAAISLFGRAQIGLDLPFGFTDADRYDEVTTLGTGLHIKPREGFAFADSRVAAKVRVFGEPDDSLTMAALVSSTIPTAMITSSGDCRDFEQCTFLGERGVQVAGMFISEFSVPEFRVAVNVGAAYRPDRTFLDAEVGSEVRYGLAGMYNVTPLFRLGAEVVGSANLLGSDDYPLEARGMLGYGQDLQVSAGGGAGILGDIGSPTYRIFLGLTYQPLTHDEDGDYIEDRDDACPADKEDRDGFADEDGCPESDNDGDSIADAADKCPNDPEDMDKFQDEDGCPELDNDGDGVPDGYDSCEGQKEDLDGDRDDDGCPDLDTDRDGVDDAHDKCPNEPEDTDGLGDDDGCPETDFDGDAVKDVEDACPDAMEWWNDILDQDGCPEDDADSDTVPDATDRCPDNAETLNGTADADGCPDGARTMILKGNLLLPTDMPVFDKDVLRGGATLVDAVADYVKRNHRKGGVRVVVVAPAAQAAEATARAQHLAGLLNRRLTTNATGVHVAGTPLHVEIELLPPGWTELPRAAPPSPPPAPATAPPAAATPAPPAAATPATAAPPAPASTP
jgi:OOP family OmpA-OmpF porin